MNARALGKVLKRFFQTRESYEILDSSKLLKNSTWMAGGCWVAAQALHDLLPGSQLLAVVAGDVQHHVVVEYRGWLFDADGAHSQRELLSYWKTQEGLHGGVWGSGPRLMPFQRSEAGEIVCPVGPLRQLKTQLKAMVQIA